MLNIGVVEPGLPVLMSTARSGPEWLACSTYESSEENEYPHKFRRRVTVETVRG